jgi:hypothetical protein
MSCSRFLVIFSLVMAVAAPLAGCGKATPAAYAPAAAPSGDPGLALVRRLNMGAGLESLANDVAHATTTFGIIAQKHGLSAADKLVKAEIYKALPAYRKRWDQNLARIYSRHFSAEELRSLAMLGTSSPYAGKFRSSHGAVGAEMRDVSGQLLQQLVTAALTHAIGQ